MVRRLVQILGGLPCDVVALDHLRRLAKPYTARVHLTAVYGSTACFDGGTTDANSSRTWLGDVLTSAEVRLKLEGVPVGVELIRGEIGLEAVRVADLADLMVLALPQPGSTDAESRFRAYLAKQLCKQGPRPLFLARGEPAVLRNILVAYDGSSDAGHALRMAADLAERANATLHLLVATAGRDNRLVGSHYLGAQVYLEAYRVPVVPHLSPLRPGAALLGLAREHPIDLIALGATGHEAAEDLETGTAAEQVIDQAGCAVLVAR